MTSIQNDDARILVVDDDRELADILVDYLSKLGYQAVAAYGGIDGLEQVKTGVFQRSLPILKCLN